jgi:hypothetical protein
MRKVGVLLLGGLLILSSGPVQRGSAQQDDGPAAPPAGTVLPLAEEIYSTTFQDGTWSQGSAEFSLVYTPVSDGLAITSLDSAQGVGFAPPPDLAIGDFYTELSFTVSGCAISESALLIYTRLTPDVQSPQDAGGYVFVLQCDGHYRARSITQGSPGPVDVEGTLSQSLAAGTDHVMGILFVANAAMWFLDGAEVAAFEVGFPIRAGGVLALGAQRGFAYTATAWRLWSVNPAGETPTGQGAAATGEGPLRATGVGPQIYAPDLSSTTAFPVGLDQPVAIIAEGAYLRLYNTLPTAILPFEDVQGRDYYVEIEFHTLDCDAGSLIGLAWRAAEAFDSFYVFGVQCDGQYRARVVTSLQAGEALVSGRVGSLAPGPAAGPVTLGVYVRGDTAWLYYAGVLVDSFVDETLTEGGVGLLLQSDPETDRAMDILVFGIGVYEAR